MTPRMAFTLALAFAAGIVLSACGRGEVAAVVEAAGAPVVTLVD
ncbi:MAG: hypothetical protein QM722_02455 [Piscinibacter sp.]